MRPLRGGLIGGFHVVETLAEEFMVRPGLFESIDDALGGVPVTVRVLQAV